MNTEKLKAVPRHSVDGYGRQDICYNDPEGEFVFYSDYEALKDALEAAQRRIAELEARKLEVIIPLRLCHDYAAVAVQQRDEQWYKSLHDACDRAGINLETGGGRERNKQRTS
ncbi:hypothetical protein PN661_003699 [Cronobacter sakazakii]|nr:hypothetical protein [Cronobacter sakazakii]EKK5312973.1 hypothetical protein [Cronobacter sakazakii]